jgi:Holliday junction resolvase RusA-like endonuclease
MNPLVLIITMKGHPAALPRARHRPGRRRPVSLIGYARLYAGALEAHARAAVARVGAGAVRRAFEGRPLVVTILWQFPTTRRERWGRLHTHTPDKDNLEKLVLDVLARAGALGGDDSRVASGLSEKRWARGGSVAIRVEAADEALPFVALGAAAALAAPPAWLAG